jgi:N-acetyl-anhydromuramyl-L-alanine amidase AmpD
MNIVKKLCKNFSERDGFKPEIIVIHISGGTEKSMNFWFNTPGSQASAHYGVGKDLYIYQYVEENKKSWSCGNVRNPSFKLYKPGINPNLYTINIECEGYDLSQASIYQIGTLVGLLKDIAKRWNIPLDRDHIIGHYQIDRINRYYCPSQDHKLLDRIVAQLQPEEIVNIQVPKSKVERVLQFIKSLIN